MQSTNSPIQHRSQRWFRRTLAMIIAAVLMHSAGVSQTPQVITLPDAIQIALRQSLDLRKATNAIALNNADVRLARSNFLPSVSLAVTPSERFGRSFDQSTGRVTTQSNSTLGLSGSVSYNVFNGFGDQAALRQSEENLQATGWNFDRAKQTIVYNVVSLYLQMARDSDQIGVSLANLAAQDSLLSQIRAFAAAGYVAVSDLYTQQAAAANAELKLITSQHDYRLSSVRLVQALELSPLGSYTFVIPGVDTNALQMPAYSLDSLLRVAESARPDILAEKQRVNAAQEGIRVARAGYWPSLTLGLNGGTSYSSSNTNSAFQDQFFTNNPNASIGATLSIPIFDRDRTGADVERARVELESEDLNLQTVNKQIALEVSQALLDASTATKQLDAAGYALASAREALDATQARYKVGVATLVELTQANATFTQAAANRVDAIYNLLLNRAAVQYYAGSIDAGSPLR